VKHFVRGIRRTSGLTGKKGPNTGRLVGKNVKGGVVEKKSGKTQKKKKSILSKEQSWKDGPSPNAEFGKREKSTEDEPRPTCKKENT